MTLVTSHMESNVTRCYPTRSRNEDEMPNTDTIGNKNKLKLDVHVYIFDFLHINPYFQINCF